jgi:hypothetical protein
MSAMFMEDEVRASPQGRFSKQSIEACFDAPHTPRMQALPQLGLDDTVRAPPTTLLVPPSDALCR